MAEEFNFGSSSSNFEELLKKYKPVDAEPTPAVQAEPEKEAEQEIVHEKKPVKKVKKAKPAVQEEKAAEPVTEQETFEEEINEIFDSVKSEREAVEEFSFDSSLLNNEPEEPQESLIEKVKDEPKFAYDLNMFGSSAQKTFDIESYDDSWLDSSLDNSIFYDPDAASKIKEQPLESFAVETAQDNAEQEDYFEEPRESNFIPVEEPEKADIASAAGGYVAQDDIEGFTFDDDSGLDFGDEEKEQPTQQPDYPAPDLEGLPVFTPAKPDKKAKKIKAKKEVNAVTDFSKDYKKGEEAAPKKKKGFFKNNFVISQEDPTAEKIRKIIMIIAVLAIIGSGLYLFNDYVIMPYRNDKDMNELNSLLGNGNSVIDEQSMEEKYPDIDFPKGMLEKYGDVYARNQDLVGWIEIAGLDISLPVVQGVDNNQYLKTDFDGKTSKYGSIFMNSTNRFDTLDYNTTLFGHHMKDQKMFGKLKQYKTVAGYKKAPVIEFGTLYADYKWKVFAVFITNGTSAGDDGYLFNYMFTDLSTNQKVEEFLGEIKLRSIYYPQVDIAVSDKILTLSTCTYELDEGRLVIMARMVRPGESEYVDVNAVRYNANPRYPQGYYEKNGKTNPYADYAKWYPS
ncbi:MAG: class B sortase [Clostridia bacterium]|nr:class B sortase [Clostridia bacterium]